MRFIKPLDHALITQIAAEHELLVTIEDNVVMGGAGSAVNEYLIGAGKTKKILNLGLPDRFQEHASREELLADAGLEPTSILLQIQQIYPSRDC